MDTEQYQELLELAEGSINLAENDISRSWEQMKQPIPLKEKEKLAEQLAEGLEALVKFTTLKKHVESRLEQ